MAALSEGVLHFFLISEPGLTPGGAVVIANQGVQGIAFFEATACLTLLVLFLHLRRDNPGVFYKLWLLGWICLTLSSFGELAYFFGLTPGLDIVAAGAGIAALMLFLASI